MPEYVYALNDYLEKVDTACNNAWWKGRTTIEGRLSLVPQKINTPSIQLTQKVSKFTMMDVQKAVEELRQLCAEEDNARCVSFASSDSTETDKPDFASDVEDWYQATETTLAEYSESGCAEKDDLEAQTATRASSFVLPRSMSCFSTLEVTTDTPDERIHSPARLSFPTSVYETIRSVPLSVSDQPTHGEASLTGLCLHTATDTAISVADGVVCAAPSDKMSSSLASMHRPSIEDKKGKERGKERHPKDWTVEEVVEWLKSKGFDKAILDKFVEQEITGEILLRLDTNLLKTEIGIAALGKRLRVASSITDLRQSSILSSSTSSSSITKTPLPSSSFRHASSSSVNLLPRKQHHSQSYHSLPEILDHYPSWSFPADFMFDGGASAEVGSSSTHGSGIGLEIPFTINEDGPMSFETCSSLSHGHSSGHTASGHHLATARTRRHSRARYTLGGSKAGACERLVPGDSGKSQKPPIVIETHMKRPLTFSLTKGVNMTSGARPGTSGASPREKEKSSYVQRPSTSGGFPRTKEKALYVQRPSTSGGSPREKEKVSYVQRPSTSGGSSREKEKASYVQRPRTSSGSQQKNSHVQLSSLKTEKDSKAIRTASTTYFQRPSTSSGLLKKVSQSPIILEAPSDVEKSQGLPTASETRKERPSTFSLSKMYFQRPSTSSGLHKGPQSLFRDSKKEKEEKTSEENLLTHRGTLRKRTSILAWRSGGPSVEGKGPIGAKGRSFYEQIGVPDHTGWMRKRADRYHVWNLRYFVLKGQRLYWFKTDDKSEAGPTGFLDVVGYRVTVDETLDTGRYGLRIDHDGEKTHFFSSDDRTVIREWMKAILKATISRDETKPVTSSASNIQTIPLAIAQAMHTRPPSPTARDVTQKAHRRENPNQLSKRDARVLGFPSAMGEQWVLFPESSVPQRSPRQLRKPFILNPTDNGLVEWANSHLPARLQIHDATTFFGGLALLRLAESIKGEQASPPVPDRAFPSGPNDAKPDGLFHLLDFLLGSGVKMGSVSINDVRLGRRDKILELLRSLKAWEEKRGRAPLTLRA